MTAPAVQFPSSRSVSSQRLGIGLVVLACSFVGASVAASGRASGLKSATGILCVIGASVAVAAAAATVREARQRRSVMFGRMLPIYYGIAFGLAGFPFILGTPQNADADQEQVLSVLPIVILGLGGWWLGYTLGRTRGVAHVCRWLGSLYARESQSLTSTWRIVALYVVASSASVLLISRNSYGYLRSADEAISSASVVDELLGTVAAFAPLALLLLALRLFTHSTTIGEKFLFGAAVCLEIVRTSFSGQKSPFLFLGLSILVAGIAVGRLAWRHVVVWSIVPIVLIFPFNSEYRSLLRPAPGQQAISEEVGAHFTSALRQTTSSATQGGYLSGALADAGARVRELDPLAVAVARHQEGLSYGSPSQPVWRTLGLLVPRVLWPGKPLDLYSLEVSRDYFGRPDTVLSSSTLTVFGDSYRYGGIVMVLLGLLYIGLLSRVIDTAFDPRRNPALLLPLVAMIPIMRQGDLAGMTASAVRTGLFLLPVLWFLGRGHRHPTS